VYIREAHPIVEWNMKANDDQGICYPQPRSLAQRVAIAGDFVRRFHYRVPLAVDAMDNRADALYGAWPERIYVIDEGGRVAYKGKLGPFHSIEELERGWPTGSRAPCLRRPRPGMTSAPFAFWNGSPARLPAEIPGNGGTT
jgi:hypothetical protein